MAVVFWPYDLLPPRNFAVTKAPATVQGAVSISGITQRMASDAGRWRATLQGVPLTTDARIKLWRQIEGLLGGQMGQIVLPVVDLDRAPATIGYTTDVGYSGSYLDLDPTASLTRNHNADLNANAAVGATRVVIDVTAGSLPEAGQFFSLGYHLYSITKIVASSAGQVVADVWPPLRKAGSANDVCDFTRPKLLCRLANDDAMATPPLEFGRWAFADLDLIEDSGEPLDGPDMIANGAFAADANWTKGTDWSITGGKAVRAAGAGATNLEQSVYLLAGASYRATFTVSAYVAGTVTPRLTGGTTVAGTARSANGTYSETLTALTGNAVFDLRATATGDYSIDDVSLVRVY